MPVRSSRVRGPTDRLVRDAVPDRPPTGPAQSGLELRRHGRHLLWSGTRFRTGGDQVTVRPRVAPARREELVDTALAVRAEEAGPDGMLHMEVTFQDRRHAERALWRLETDAEALGPQWLRDRLHERAAALAGRYRTSPGG